MAAPSRYRDLVFSLYRNNLMFQQVKMGLANMVALNDAMGRPTDLFRVVHVAGTNGKGSVSWKIARGVQSHGIRTGLFVSPHLACFRERIQVDGQLISEEAVEFFLPLILREAQERDIPATFFELVTQLAFCYYAATGTEVVALETGLGGRLDATNIVSPALSVITSIGLDHTRILGDTIEAIALEKAGIIKPGVPVVLGPNAAVEHILPVAADRGSPAVVVTPPTDARHAAGSTRGDRDGDRGDVSLHEWQMNYDAENTAVAQQALELLEDRGVLPVPSEAVLRRRYDAVRTSPPSRFEAVRVAVSTRDAAAARGGGGVSLTASDAVGSGGRLASGRAQGGDEVAKGATGIARPSAPSAGRRGADGYPAGAGAGAGARAGAGAGAGAEPGPGVQSGSGAGEGAAARARAGAGTGGGAGAGAGGGAGAGAGAGEGAGAGAGTAPASGTRTTTEAEAGTGTGTGGAGAVAQPGAVAGAGAGVGADERGQEGRGGQRNVMVLLDGGHNPAAFEKLMCRLKFTFPDTPFRFVIGMSGDKAASDFLPQLAEYTATPPSRFHFVSSVHARAAPAADLAEALGLPGVPPSHVHPQGAYGESAGAGIRQALAAALSPSAAPGADTRHAGDTSAPTAAGRHGAHVDGAHVDGAAHADAAHAGSLVCRPEASTCHTAGYSLGDAVRDLATSDSPARELVVVCGSVYLMMEAREVLGYDEPRDEPDAQPKPV